MIRNYFKIALRNILKNKLSSFINIFGLALSMSIGLIIILLVSDLFKYDRFHEKKDHVFRIISKVESRYGKTDFACCPLPLAEKVMESYPGILGLVEMKKAAAMTEYKGKQIAGSGLFASEQFFELFTFRLQNGNPANALLNPYSVVITEEFADKMFGDQDPIGETMEFETLGSYEITGIIKNEGNKSHLQFDFLLSFETYKILNKVQNLDRITIIAADDEDIDELRLSAQWRDFYSNYAYVLLDENANKEDLKQYVNTVFANQHVDMKGSSVLFDLQALTEISPGGMMANEIGFTFPLIMIIIFGSIAFIIVILASFNYTNLTLARSLTRAKEVGIRKVMGAVRFKIISQYIIESIIISLFALLLGVLFSQMIIPSIMSLDPIMHKVFSFSYNIKTIVYSILFSLLVGTIAGLLPSLYLSSFKPINVLKGVVKIRLFGGLNLRKILLAIQFTVSIIFVIMTVLLFSQIQVIKNTDLGFETDHRMVIELQGMNYNFFANEIKSNPNIINLSASSGIPVIGGSWSSTEIKIKPDGEKSSIYDYSVTPDFIPNMKLKIIAGRNFDAYDTIGGDKSVILNEAALKYYALGQPKESIGKKIYMGESQMEIVGIVKDFFIQTTVEKISPVLLRFKPEYIDQLIVYYQKNASKQDLVDSFTSKWDNLEATNSFRYFFMDENLGFLNKIYDYIIKIVAYVAILAITIACLGLLGMMAFNTQSRLKEIGIRKVFGINKFQITLLLAKDYLILILISSILSLTIIWLVCGQIKMMLPNSIGFEMVSVLIGFGFIIMIVLFTIFSQTRKAERSDPIEALRYE